MLDDGIELARFAYDGNGRRVQKVSGGLTRSYFYGGLDILEERSSAGTIRTVHAPGVDHQLAPVDISGTVSYYLADHLGSIVQQTDASASVTLTRQYDPYGFPLQGAATSGYAFTGLQWDAEILLRQSAVRARRPMKSPMRDDNHSVSLSGREALYLKNAVFLPQELRRIISTAPVQPDTSIVIAVSRDISERFRDAFTERLAKVGFDRAYEPTGEGRLLEALIDRFFNV